MRTVRILNEAAQEAIEAAAWYEQKQSGLGAQFFAAVEAAFDALENNTIPLSPLSYKTAATNAKRLILKHFPYDIVVIEQPGGIIVIAVAHHARKPGYWLERHKN